VGKKRFLPAKSVRSTESLPADGPLAAVDTSSAFLELRLVVSTGSGANRRTFFELSSIGTGWNRLVEGGVSDIVLAFLSLGEAVPNHSIVGKNWTHSNARETRNGDRCSCL
jgi:hypothetical protein